MLNLKSLKKDIILAPFTTYKIGGPADYFIEVTTKEELSTAILESRKNKIPYFLLGTGANVLIGDKGYRGLVIYNLASNFHFKGEKLIAESGSTIADLIEASAEKELSGLEHYAGIPSSVGGAIWQNLHFLSPDRQNTIFIEEIVNAALILNEKNEVKKVDRNYFKFSYDDSLLHHKEIVVLEVTFALTSKSPKLIKKQIEANLAWRNQKQPQLREFPSCGSVFQKIKDVGAGRLIDNVGLKGKRVGDAQVSKKHANYIVNRGKATAKDVRKLIKIIEKEVKESTGYKLKPEISFIGEF